MPQIDESLRYPPISNLPKHVAIIMDGNNRWAKKRHLPSVAGHKAGVDAVRAVVEMSAKYGIEALTLFAFSSENWQRPANEVSALMSLFLAALKREVSKLHRNNIRLKIIGDLSGFNDQIRDHVIKAEALTADNTGLKLNIAANYGGRWDIAQATRGLIADLQAGHLSAESVTEETLGQYLSLADLPEPDLCVRTGGELRVSNFMLWQFAYTELYFTESYWPDFKYDEYRKALQAYSGRQRRFGKTDEQLEAIKSSA